MTESRSIIELKRKAKALNLCGEYDAKWDTAETDKELFDLASDINGADFLCASEANGWGLGKHILAGRFAPYMNGRYKSTHNGYSSAMFCAHNGVVNVDATIVIVMYSDCKIVVPQNSACKIFLAKNDKVEIENHGFAEIICYDSLQPKINGDGKTDMTDPFRQKDSWINFSNG